MDAWFEKIVSECQSLEGPLLPMLHAVQAHCGFIPSELVPDIARTLNISSAEVYGVISFYSDFRQDTNDEQDQHVIQICAAEACQARGSRDLETFAHAHIANGHANGENKVRLERVYCLGNCACGPSLRCGDNVLGRVTPERLQSLVAHIEHDTHVEQEEVHASNVDADLSQANTKILYLPQDSSACALGADDVAKAVLTGIADESLSWALVRNGSRGVFWLEPLLELETAEGRIGFGPVNEADVPSILDAIQHQPELHPLHLGLVEDIPYIKQQQRLTFVRAGINDPLSISGYQKLDGFLGLRNALTMTPAAIVEQIIASGLRGRGGAAFPAGIKWQTVHQAHAEQKYIVCNADEGDSGTFADRLLMESDPYQLIEGMVIAGLAVGATRGYIYLRSEYPKAFDMLRRAIAKASEAGWLGDQIAGSDNSFHLEVRLGAGAYICGEETSLLNSLEGQRGVVRSKPPLPALEGFFGQPTVVNNVLTLAAVTTILAKGAPFYRDFGVGRSRGTLPLQLSGNVQRGGLVELAFGASLRELVSTFAGSTESGRPIKAIQVGGPLGAYIPETHWDTALDYEAFADIGAMLGHGGIVVFDDSVNMLEQAKFAMEFCAEESCGKCTPCRIGSVRGVEVIERIARRENTADNKILLHDLCDTMEHGSLCAMGGLTPMPVRSALKHFSEDF